MSVASISEKFLVPLFTKRWRNATSVNSKLFTIPNGVEQRNVRDMSEASISEKFFAELFYKKATNKKQKRKHKNTKK